MGLSLYGTGRHAEASAALHRSLVIQERLIRDNPTVVQYQNELALNLGNLAKVHQALNQPPRAIQARREWADLVRGNPNALYDVTCALALTVPLVPGDQKQVLAAEAVQWLREAIAAGWHDAVHTSRDSDLDPLRDRDDFRRLLAELFDRDFPTDPFAQ
jgi:hypothetical protein